LEAVAEGWVAHVDGEGRTFYANSKTGESSWTAPEPDTPLPHGWVASQDNEGRTYYSNAITGESTWTRPEACVVPTFPDGWAAHEDAEGRTYYLNASTGESSWTLPDDSPLPAGWSVNQDSEGRTFYANLATGEASWERPSASLISMAAPVISKEFGRRRNNDDSTETKGTLASCLNEWLMCAGFFKLINSFAVKNAHKFEDADANGSGHSLESYAMFKEYESMLSLRCETFLVMEGATPEEAVDSMLLEEDEPGSKFKVCEYLMAAISFESFVSLMLDFKSGDKDLSRWSEMFQELNDWTWVPAE